MSSGDVFSNLLSAKKSKQPDVSVSDLNLDKVGETSLTGKTLLQRNVATRILLAVLTTNDKFKQVIALTYILRAKEPLRGDFGEKLAAFMSDPKNGEVINVAKQNVAH